MVAERENWNMLMMLKIRWTSRLWKKKRRIKLDTTLRVFRWPDQLLKKFDHEKYKNTFLSHFTKRQSQCCCPRLPLSTLASYRQAPAPSTPSPTFETQQIDYPPLPIAVASLQSNPSSSLGLAFLASDRRPFCALLCIVCFLCPNLLLRCVD